MAFGEITIEKLLEVTDRELTEAKLNLGKAYISVNETSKDNQELKTILVYLANAFSTVNEWQEYYHRFNSILTDKAEADKAEIQELKNKVNNLLEANKKLIEDNVKLMNDNSKLMDKNVELLKESLDTISKNAKLIAASEGNREKTKKAVGNNSNRFIQELDTEKLIEVYKGNNYSIPKEVKEFYFRNYGITYNGLRERLIKAGVWRGRR